MAATLEEYRDILIADTYVDLARLKMRAQHGIPSEIRAEVWKYLLDVSKPDKSEEVSTTKRLAENYWDMSTDLACVSTTKRLAENYWDMTETAQNDVETLRSKEAAEKYWDMAETAQNDFETLRRSHARLLEKVRLFPSW
ncbi:hypothetical protein T484DRAFT_1853893 [Baffinella frigidus]|nr:hypothetical protein T484DRAFT_1853893 [Cryptophyta sp. CCMP2293]